MESTLPTVILFVIGINLFLSTTTQADPLPSPLTLQQALRLSAHGNPDTQIARAKRNFAQAKLAEQNSRAGLDTFVEIRPTWAKQARTKTEVSDGYIHFGARWVLFDFGLTAAKQSQFQLNLVSEKNLEQRSIIQHQIDTIAAFYQVILSDLRYTADNEAMTVNFLRYDRVRERYKLGKISDLVLAEAEYNYRLLLNQRKISEGQQRLSRQQLAILLNRPDDIPSDLQLPAAQFVDKKIPDAVLFFQESRSKNPLLKSLTNAMESKRAAHRATTRNDYPVITAELDVNEFEIDKNSRNNVEFGLRFKLPLYQSGLNRAKLVQANSELHISMAQLQFAEQQLRQDILALVLHLETLQLQKSASRQEMDYRDINLDKRRAEYELEIKSSIGTAMSKLTKAQWLAASIDFEIELSWIRLLALQGMGPALLPHDFLNQELAK